MYNYPKIPLKLRVLSCDNITTHVLCVYNEKYRHIEDDMVDLVDLTFKVINHHRTTTVNEYVAKFLLSALMCHHTVPDVLHFKY